MISCLSPSCGIRTQRLENKFKQSTATRRMPSGSQHKYPEAVMDAHLHSHVSQSMPVWGFTSLEACDGSGNLVCPPNWGSLNDPEKRGPPGVRFLGPNFDPTSVATTVLAILVRPKKRTTKRTPKWGTPTHVCQSLCRHSAETTQHCSKGACRAVQSSTNDATRNLKQQQGGATSTPGGRDS